MSSRHWQQLEKLFGEALDLAKEERRAFLESACEGDADLLGELEELLAEDSATGSFLDRPLLPPVEHGLLKEPKAPEQIGPYQLLERLGEGGMGVVFRAARNDGAFEREVAIKLLRGGLSPDAVLRFQNERQILANLDHPFIARLFDGGTTPEGVPFVVIELVDGLPIDAWCDASQLDASSRLETFLGVCDAVSAAHRSLVVHCDLKPSNILVTRDGTPKLLDFGIARLLDLDPESPGQGGEASSVRQLLLTPSYASPEQLKGERITVVTDVYLLGIVLYKLLSGKVPHRIEGLTLREATSLICERAPCPPSVALRQNPDAEHSVEKIDAELDAIVLKALQPEPQARYASVDQLIDDLRRHQQALPVLAMGGTWRYRAGKFLRRHWVPAGLAALALVLISIFGFYWREQAHSLDRALTRSVKVERFLREIVWSVDPSHAGSSDLQVADWLESGSGRLGHVFEDQPEVEAPLRALFGRILINIDRQQQARAQLEEARRLFREEIAEDGADLKRVEIRALSDLAVAWFLSADSDAEIAESEELGRHAAALARSVLRQDPEELLSILANLALIYCWQSKSGELVPLSEEMLALAHTSGAGDRLVVAKALEQQALVLKNVAGDLQASRELYLEALAMFRRLEGDVHPEVANLYNQLGIVAQKMGELELAVSYQREGVAIRRQLYSPGHREIAKGLYNLASALRRQGRFGDSAEHLREAIAIYRQHPDLGLSYPWAGQSVVELAELLLLQGVSAGEVEALISDGIPQAWWDQRAPESRLLAWARGVLGRTQALQGRHRHQEARLLLEKAHRIFTENPNGFERQAEQTRVWLEELDN